MKILILYTYNKGFLSGFFYELSDRLSQEGHEVINFSFKDKNSRLKKNNVSILIYKKGGYISNYYKIYRAIKKVRPDIVLSNFSYVNPALLFGKLFGVKKNIVWFHSLKEQINPSLFKIFVKTQFLKLADNIIANSYEMKNELNDTYNVPLEKLKAIPFWTTIDNPTNKEIKVKKNIVKNVFMIGCPGRLVVHKNQRIVIETLPRLKQISNVNFQLYIAGSGKDLKSLKDLVNNLNLTESVVFLGHLSENQMISFYNDMDVIVLPSLHEAFGLVFIEAISFGTPVIVSNNFGALSFLDIMGFYSIKDFTFNPDDVSELCLKLMSYSKGNGIDGNYFKQLCLDNFDKEIIYNKIKNILMF